MIQNEPIWIDENELNIEEENKEEKEKEYLIVGENIINIKKLNKINKKKIAILLEDHRR